MRAIVTDKGREVHGREKARALLKLSWGLLLLLVGAPIRLVAGRWPWETAWVQFGKADQR